MTKKVIILLPSLTLGGAEKQALFYARTIQESAVAKVKVIGMGKEGELVNQLKEHNIAYGHFKLEYILSNNWWKKIGELIRFAIFLRKEKAHTCIAFTYWPNAIGSAIYRYAGIKNFYWNQRSIDDLMGISFLEKIGRKNNLRYISNSLCTSDFITKRHQIPSNNSVKVIPNFVEIPDEKEILNPNKSSFQLLMVANYYPEKDQQTVLLAVKLLSEKYPDKNIQLTLLGKAPGISPALLSMKSLAFDLGLYKKVEFVEESTNLKHLLSQTHLGILSTFSEGCSNAVMEYMAYGLPVAVTKIPANEELISDPDQLFPIQDVDALAKIMENAMIHPQLYHEKGLQNKNFIQQHFLKEQIKPLILQLIK